MKKNDLTSENENGIDDNSSSSDEVKRSADSDLNNNAKRFNEQKQNAFSDANDVQESDDINEAKKDL